MAQNEAAPLPGTAPITDAGMNSGLSAVPVLCMGMTARVADPAIARLQAMLAPDMTLVRGPDIRPTEDGRTPEAPAGNARTVLVLCPAAPRALARSMAAGIPPSEALADWSEAAATLLALWQRQRARIRILDPDQVLACHAGALRQALGLAGPPRAPVPPVHPAEATLPDPALALLAHRALAGDAEARTRAGTLQAATLELLPAPGFEPAPLDDPDLAFARLGQLRALPAALELAEARARDQQALLEATQARLQEQAAAATALRADLAASTARVAGLDAQMAGKDASLAAAGRALALREAEIQALTDTLATREAAAERLAAERDAARAELDRVMNSRSVRMMAPFRRLRGVLRG
ncbi:hypothetical protein [Chachezhania sediminis]|uniref:hypothetical protein n=1 Tax=Chachezhania sediminis TaxID=2599291 RepID=UPI00131A66E8|nr:hypothetical protein [Chachezhania sediminis]